MASNPFASLISGLGIKLPTLTSSPKSTYTSNLMTPAPNMTSAATKKPVYGGPAKTVASPAPQKATVSPFASTTYSAGNAPYSTVSPGGGPMSTTANLQKTVKPAPNMTDAATRQPVYGGPVRSSTANMSVPKNQSTPKDAFVSNSLATSNASATSPAATGSTELGGFGDSSFDSSSFSSGGSTSSGSGSGFGGSMGYSEGVSGRSPSYRQQYLDVLSGIYSDDELKKANRQIRNLDEDASEIKLEERQNERYIKKNEAGALARGVDSQLARNTRDSAAGLADIAIARAPYDNYVSSMMDAYKSAADYEGDSNEPFTLSEGQVRYAYDPASGSYKSVGGSGQGGGMSTSDPIVQSWAQGVRSKQYDISNVPESLRNAVVQALGSQPASANPEVQAAVEKAGTMLGGNGQTGLIDQALGLLGPMTSGLVGSQGNKIPGTKGYDLSKAVDTIKANLGFQALAEMRAASPTGGALGSITERELQFLQATVASLDLGQSEPQIRRNLEAIRQHYQNWVQAVQQANNAGGGGNDDFNF